MPPLILKSFGSVQGERNRVLKINNVNLFLGNTTQENIRISYCLAKGITWMQLYGLYSVFGDAAKETLLASFISRCYAAGIKRVGAIMGAGNAGFILALTYNASVPLNSQFYDMNKECEFWNFPAPGTENFAAWIASMVWLNANVDKATTVTSAYIQNYNVPVWGAVEALLMVQNIDYLETTNYTVTPNEPQVRDTMLKLLATAAATALKVQKINDLLSAEAAFIGPYVQANGIGKTEDNWRQQYTPDVFASKANLQITGFNWFDYNNLKVYSP